LKERGIGVTTIGSRVPSIDAVEKVTGRLQFGSDFRLPGMLYGKILRSPFPHARIVSIDASRARKLPGVRVVITGWDYEFPSYSVVGGRNADERLLAREKVRYIGDEVAAVAAVDESTADRALETIAVEYRELPALFDPEEAMREGAILVHENVTRNIARVIRIRHGEVTKALNESDAVVEETFRTPLVHQAYLEPHAAVAQWDSQGRLTLWIPTQSPFLAQMTYSKALGITPEKVRVIQMPMGGAFGGKLEYKLHPICALLAREARVPVKMVNTREEEFTASLPRVPMITKMRAGCKKDGSLMAKEAKIIADNGAYLNYGPGILLSAATRHDNLYRLKNIHTDAYLVYTNKISTGCFRGFGCPQSFFAFESVIDMLADEINMDPADFRLKNASEAGDRTPHGWYFGSCGLSTAIQACVKKAGWSRKRRDLRKMRSKSKARGIGLACCLHVSGNRAFFPFFDGASAYVRVTDQGLVIVSTGEPDLGQGSRTIFALIASHELGVPLEWVRVSWLDTDFSPYGLGTFGDRTTTLAGNAVKAAAIDARNQLLGVASRRFGGELSDFVVQDGVICSKSNKAVRMEFKEAARLFCYENAGATVLGHGKFTPQNVSMVDPDTKIGNISCAYPFVAQVAEVEVNLKSGEVTVLSVTAAHDLGRVINPLLAEGQVHGAVMQGIGFALSEEMVVEKGRIVNANFGAYKVPRATEVPCIETIFVESDDPNGPYGAKGLAEPALTPIAPAIANAIYSAVGVRLKNLPMTRIKVKNAIRSQPRVNNIEDGHGRPARTGRSTMATKTPHE
jgi:CO/xanthine dehydrogenase Mo-binding subunit